MCLYNKFGKHRSKDVRSLGGEKMSSQKTKSSDRKVVKISSKGQITLPKKIRQELGINKGDWLEIYKLDEGRYALKKRTPLQELAEEIADEAREKGYTKEDLEETIEEVRKKLWKRLYSEIDEKDESKH